MTPTSPTGCQEFRLEFREWIKLFLLAMTVVSAAYSMHAQAIFRIGVNESEIRNLHQSVNRIADRLDRAEGVPAGRQSRSSPPEVRLR